LLGNRLSVGLRTSCAYDRTHVWHVDWRRAV